MVIFHSYVSLPEGIQDFLRNMSEEQQECRSYWEDLGRQLQGLHCSQDRPWNDPFRGTGLHSPFAFINHSIGLKLLRENLQETMIYYSSYHHIYIYILYIYISKSNVEVWGFLYIFAWTNQINSISYLCICFADDMTMMPIGFDVGDVLLDIFHFTRGLIYSTGGSRSDCDFKFSGFRVLI